MRLNKFVLLEKIKCCFSSHIDKHMAVGHGPDIDMGLLPHPPRIILSHPVFGKPHTLYILDMGAINRKKGSNGPFVTS